MAEMLACNDHRAFPVVETTPSGSEVFKGIILRNHVLSILAKEALFMEADNPVVLSKTPSLGRFVGWLAVEYNGGIRSRSWTLSIVVMRTATQLAKLSLSVCVCIVLDDTGDGITAVHMETLDVAELVNLDDKMPLTLAAKNEGEKRVLLEK